jgi:cation:H+ antiporter
MARSFMLDHDGMPLVKRASRRLSWLSINIALYIIAASVIAGFNQSSIDFIKSRLEAAPTPPIDIFFGGCGFQPRKSDIAIGNVLGSNVANVFLILGISSVIYPLAVTKGTVWKEIPFSLLAAIVLLLTVNDRFLDGAGTSALTRIDGLIFFCFFAVFIYYTFSIAERVEGMEQHVPAKHNGWLRSLLCIIAGLAGLTIGGKWIVDGAIALATKLGMSESLIGLTIVAVGTSLPELATSAVAAYKKNVEIAVGNVVGSNIFNIFFVLGISATIKPLPFQTKNNVDIGAVIFSSLMLFFFMFTGKKRSLDRWEGIVFLLFYAGYVTLLIIIGK